MTTMVPSPTHAGTVIGALEIPPVGPAGADTALALRELLKFERFWYPEGSLPQLLLDRMLSLLILIPEEGIAAPMQQELLELATQVHEHVAARTDPATTTEPDTSDTPDTPDTPRHIHARLTVPEYVDTAAEESTPPVDTEREVAEIEQRAHNKLAAFLGEHQAASPFALFKDEPFAQVAALADLPFTERKALLEEAGTTIELFEQWSALLPIMAEVVPETEGETFGAVVEAFFASRGTATGA